MNLHVEVSGHGPDLVLVHGWGLHGGFFAPLVERLVPRFRVHVVDLPGHGGSRSVTADGLAGWARAVAAVVPDRAIWLGWSLGGMIAVSHALQHPEAVKRLVTVASTPRFLTADDWPHATTPDSLARFGEVFKVDYRKAISDFLTLQVQGDAHARGLLRELRPRLFDHGEPDGAGLEAGLDILRETDLRPALVGLRVPLLAVAGARDLLVPPVAVLSLAEAVPDGRVVIFERAAHAPFLSEPDRFAELVSGFAA